MPGILQPKNEDETSLAIALQRALDGSSIATSHYQHQLLVIQKLEGGNLARMRPEFQRCVLEVVLPILEQATFEAPIVSSNIEDAGEALKQMRERNAQALTTAVRSAAIKLNAEAHQSTDA